MSQNNKFKTISDDKFKIAAKYVDNALVPVIKQFIEKANQKMSKQGIRVAAEISWMFDEVVEEKDKNENST